MAIFIKAARRKITDDVFVRPQVSLIMRPAVVLMGLVACRVLDIPPVQIGAVRGRVAVVAPTGEVVPAVGANIRFAGTSIATTSNEGGLFRLEPVLSTQGSLVVEYDPHQPGVSAKSRTFDFETWAIAPSHDVSLGDVLLGDPATVTGQVLLANVTEAAGQGGSIVVAAGTTTLAFSALDGTFTLRGVPEGRMSLTLMHTGYQTAHVTSFEVRAGEAVTLAPVTLVPSTATGSGVIAGRLVSSSAAAVTGGVAEARGPEGKRYEVGADGLFSISLTPGLYEFRLRLAAHSDLILHNLVVSPGATLSLGDVILGPGSASVEFPDAGGVDGGVVPSGCGDGRVSATEVCDVGAPNGHLACSPDCRSLRRQGPGATSCGNVPVVAFTPAGAGDLHAALTLKSNGATLQDTVCGMSGPNPNIVDLVVDADAGALLSWTTASEGPSFMLRRTCADPTTVVMCAIDGQTVALRPGRYSLLMAFNGTGERDVELALQPVHGPFCGDGVVSGTEACEPVAGSHLCTRTCALASQAPGATCGQAPVVEWIDIAPGRHRAQIQTNASHANGSTLDPPAPCANAVPDRFARIDVARPGTLTATVAFAGSVFLGVWDLTSQPCSPSLPSMACSAGPPAGPDLALGVNLDAGTYLLGIGSTSSVITTVALELDDH